MLNHLYLEDCFIKWKHLPEAGDDRYTAFPHGVNFMTLLGNAKLTDTDLERWTAAAKDIDDDDDMQEVDGDITATGITLPTQLSGEGSQRDRTIRQDLTGGGADGMDVDAPDLAGPPPLPPVKESAQQMDLVGGDAEESRLPQTSMEQDQPVPRSASGTTPQPEQNENATDAEGAPEETSSVPEGEAATIPDAPVVDELMQEDKVHLHVEADNQDDGADVAMNGHDDGAEIMVSQANHAAMREAQDKIVNEADQAVPGPSNIQVVVDPPTSPISDPPVEEELVPPTTQAKGKGKAPAKVSKKSRPVTAPTTQASKRRRVSTPEKPEVPAAEPPVFEGRVRRQAASKAADMLHHVIAPDMALHEKEKKRKDIVSPKSRRAARLGALEEGSSRRSKETSVSENEEPTEDETEPQRQAKSTQRAGKKATSARGRSRSAIVRDTARSQLGTRSASVLSGSSGEEEDREGDLIGSQVRLMCTGYNLDDKMGKVGDAPL